MAFKIFNSRSRMQLSSFCSKIIALQIFLVTYHNSDSRINTNQTLLDVGTLLISIVIRHKFSLSILHLALHVIWLFLETLNKLHGLLLFVICLLFDSYSINRYIAQNLHCCRTKREKNKWVSTQWFINMVHSSDSLWTQNWINFSKKLQSLSIICNDSTFFGLVYNIWISGKS